MEILEPDKIFRRLRDISPVIRTEIIPKRVGNSYSVFATEASDFYF